MSPTSPWERLIEKPQPGGHFVQLCEPGDHASLVRNIGLYVSEGMKRGEGSLLIATAENRDAFIRELDRLRVDALSAIDEKRLVCVDAQETLARFMVAGQPDWDRFESTVRRAMREVRPAQDYGRLRAYGEMVGLLWSARQFSAAIRLEQFWNKLLARSSFGLYCAYSMDVLEKQPQLGALEGVLCTHTHLIPSEAHRNLEASINLAMDDILGVNADAVRARMKANPRLPWAVMPKGETAMLWLRRNLPEEAEHIAARVRGYALRTSAAPADAFAHK
jgi:MEDS: MEthanogen/methylotroph, DcmR Sensory domain